MKKIVGIVSDGRRGESIAHRFAKRRFEVYLYDIDKKRNQEYLSGVRKEIEVIALSGRPSVLPINDKQMKWVSSIEELADCELLIDAVYTEPNIPKKPQIIHQLSQIVSKDIPILSNDHLNIPSRLSAHLSDNSNFTIAYFYDIEYGVANVDLIIHAGLCPDVKQKIDTFLKQGAFAATTMKECYGFVRNRVGLAGILSLLYYYDRGIFSFDNLCKYHILTRMDPYIVNIPLGTEMKTELYALLPLVEKLYHQHGKRFYRPAFLKQSYTLQTLPDTIHQFEKSGSYGLSETEKAKQGQGFQHILLSGIDLIHNNLLFALLNNSSVTLYYDHADENYSTVLEQQNPKLYKRFKEEVTHIFPDSPISAFPIDCIIESKVENLDQKKARLKALQTRFGVDIVLLVNSPIYKIETIARGMPAPARICGMYTQKNFLPNTELVRSANVDQEVYRKVYNWLHQITSDIIETKDINVRPLASMILVKMFESTYVYAEGLADMNAIDILGVDRSLFRDMDLMGLDTIALISQYLASELPEFYTLPALISQLIEEGRTGYKSGQGFHSYKKKERVI